MSVRMWTSSIVDCFQLPGQIVNSIYQPRRSTPSLLIFRLPEACCLTRFLLKTTMAVKGLPRTWAVPFAKNNHDASERAGCNLREATLVNKCSSKYVTSLGFYIMICAACDLWMFVQRKTLFPLQKSLFQWQLVNNWTLTSYQPNTVTSVQFSDGLKNKTQSVKNSHPPPTPTPPSPANI